MLKNATNGIFLSFAGMLCLLCFASFTPALPGGDCNVNRAEAAARSNQAFKECAADHRLDGIAFYTETSTAPSGACEYIVWAVDPFRCPPGQICPLVLIAPFSRIVVDENYNVVVVSCYPYIFP